MYNFLKRLAFTPFVMWKHGSPSPKSIKLGQGGSELHVNPNDWRAFKKIIIDTARGRESTPMMFWKDHAAAHPSATMLDIGTNYGECFFFPEYTDQTCVSIEANPGLIPLLEASKAGNPHRERMTIAHTLLSDTEQESVPFYYSSNWTGTGSGTRPAGDDVKTIHVRSTTLDDVLAECDLDIDAPLVFKMDIEGFEAKAFAGFDSMTEFKRRIGILEFDPNLIERSGESAQAFFEFLAAHHQIYLTHRKSRQLSLIQDWDDLLSRLDKHAHCDLVIATDAEMIAGNWHVVDSGRQLRQAA